MISIFMISVCVASVSIVSAVKLEIGTCLLPISEKCTSETISVYLFTSDRRNESILLNPDAINLPEWINLNRTNKLLVHGYGGNLEFYATKTIRNAYLQGSDTNVIVVDWGKLAPLPCYPMAAINTKFVAKCTADLLLKLKKYYGVGFELKRIHGIGFSLGAHVVSFISNRILYKSGVKFERITGLDPALPFFATNNLNRKLDASDADFVDVIHSNAGIFGKIEPSGHLDFYMNGGQIQPACKNHKNAPLCSHLLSTLYFAESINTDIGFWGIPCKSYIQFIFGMCSIRSPFFICERIIMGEHSFSHQMFVFDFLVNRL